jgi:hypothetical protein
MALDTHELKRNVVVIPGGFGNQPNRYAHEPHSIDVNGQFDDTTSKQKRRQRRARLSFRRISSLASSFSDGGKQECASGGDLTLVFSDGDLFVVWHVKARTSRQGSSSFELESEEDGDFSGGAGASCVVTGVSFFSNEHMTKAMTKT